MYSRNILQHSRQGISRGYSLLELSVVVLIVGIMAAAVIPTFSSAQTDKLDLAAEIQAEAMRFARAEAMRRGEPMGFRQQDIQKRIRVFNLDTGTAPWTKIYDVYHPVSKQIWDIQLDLHSLAHAETVVGNRVYRGVCNTPRSVYFDAHGIARCADPETVLLELYEITLTIGSDSRTVSLDGVSGKVVIQ